MIKASDFDKSSWEMNEQIMSLNNMVNSFDLISNNKDYNMESNYLLLVFSMFKN